MRIFLMVLLGLIWLPGSLRAAEPVSISFNDLTLNGFLETGGEGAISERMLLLLHGNRAHGEMEIIKLLQETLQSKGIGSLAMTLSLGDSDRTGMYSCDPVQKYSVYDSIDELNAWLDWLEGKGAKEIFIVGHSLGGNQVSVFMAKHDRPTVHGAVLVAPAIATNYRSFIDGYQGRFGKPLGPTLEKANSLVTQGKGETVLEDVGFQNCEKAKVTARAFAAMYGEDERRDTLALIPKIKKPVMVVAAELDQVVKDLKEKIETVSSPNLRVEMVMGADHFFLDLYGEDLADLIADFVAK